MSYGIEEYSPLMDGGDCMQVLHAIVWRTMELDLINYKFFYDRARELHSVFDIQMCGPLGSMVHEVGTKLHSWYPLHEP